MDGFEPKPITLTRLHVCLPPLPKRSGPRSSVYVEQEETASPASASGIDAARKAELVEVLGEEIFEELVAAFFADAEALMRDYRQARLAGNAPRPIRLCIR